jgi:hypothetical protein
MKFLRYILVFLLLFPSFIEISLCQTLLPSAATVTQNFNAMGTGMALPANWRIQQGNTPTWAAGSGNVTQVQTTTATCITTGGTYNFMSIATERAVGALTSGSFASPNSIMGYFRNTNTSNLTQLTVSYNAERYKVNVTNASIQFYYSTDGINWTVVTAGEVLSSSFPVSATVTCGFPLSTVNVSAFTITGLNIAPNNDIYLRWNLNTIGSNSQAIGIDDIDVTPGFVSCTTPDAIEFVQQPSNVQQNSAMTPSVTIRAYCTATGATASSYSGAITITVNNGCGYTFTQVVTATNGIATFNNIVFTRSPQANVSFTASASGFVSVTSNTFNVTSPAGAPITTVLRNQNWDGGTPAWTYVIGTATSVGTGGTIGTDVTGTVNPTGTNTYLRKSYSVNNASGATGSMNTVTFDTVAGLTVYNDVVFTFQIASLNEAGTAIGTGGAGGRGVDITEDMIVETELNNSGTWNFLLRFEGRSNKVFPFSAATPDLLAYNANAFYPYTSTQSAFQVTLPPGTTIFRFRFRASNNRIEENWCIDNVKLVGINYPVGNPFPLPIADAGNDVIICPGTSTQLTGSVQNANGVPFYTWTPAATLNNSSIQNPVATPVSTTIYSLTVTDGDGCSSTDVVQVSIPSGGSGVWTGAVDDDWYNCKNWADGFVPTITTDVTIPATALNPANINYLSPLAGPGIAYCRNIQISGKPLVIEGSINNILEIRGNLILSATGTIDMDDGSNATADGIIKLSGDWTNNLNESQFAEGNGTVQFVGSTNQNIINFPSVNESFYYMVINNSGGRIILISNVSISIGGSCTFINGIVDAFSNSRDMFYYLNATAVGANASSFVEGNVRKIGDNAFTFPVGKDPWGYRPIGISTPASQSDVFRSSYVRASAMALGPITAPGLNHVSYCEYWHLDRLNGVSVVDVIASWDLTSCGVTSLPDLVIAHFNGISWDTYGGAGTAVGTTSSGTVTWPLVSVFSPFTLGSLTTQNPLPVDLLYFNAHKNDKNSVICNWKTFSEINNDRFEIYTSRNNNGAVTWTFAGSVKGHGTTSEENEYHFIDENPAAGKNYYRLKQLDYDGTYTFSDIVVVDFGNENVPVVFSVSPNPFTESADIYFQTPSAGRMIIEIYDLPGKLISSNEISISKGSASLPLPMNPNVNSGIYFVSIDIDGYRSIHRIIKQ